MLEQFQPDVVTFGQAAQPDGLLGAVALVGVGSDGYVWADGFADGPQTVRILVRVTAYLGFEGSDAQPHKPEALLSHSVGRATGDFDRHRHAGLVSSAEERADGHAERLTEEVVQG